MARKRSRKRRREEEGQDSFWQRRSPRMQHGLCVLTLLVVSVAFFAPMHFSGKSLIGGDTVRWRAMAEAMAEYEATTGREALWNPNAFAGMPGYMTYYSEQIPQLDDLVHFLRGYVWPTSHFFFLLLGTYLLVFFLTKRKLSSVLAACAYGLTTYIPILLVAGHNTKFIALCFAPWLALAFAYTLRKPKLLSGLLFAAALALNLRAGHVQITYYITFLLGVWWVVEGVGAVRNGRLQAFGKATGYLAVGSVLGLMMVAQPYLIHAEYKAFTTRGGAATAAGGEAGLALDYAMSWSQGVGELVTLAIAGAYGGTGPTYWGPKPFTAGPHYVGGIVLLLAALALWKLRKNVVWAFGLGALLMTLFALGHHLSILNEFMFAYFPLFDAFRVPETWLSMVAFALAVLAGFGLFYVVRKASSPAAEQQKTKAIYTAVGVIAGFVLVLLVMRGAFFDFEKPNERQRITRQVAQQIAQQISQQRPDLSLQSAQVQQVVQQQTQQVLTRLEEQRIDKFTSDAWRTLIFVLLAGGLLVLYRRDTIPTWAMQAGLVLLVVVDLGGVGRRYLNEDVMTTASSIAAEIPKFPFDAFILQKREAAGGPGHFRVLSLELGRSPFSNARPSYYYESLGGYHGAKLQRYQDYIDHIFRNPETGRISENALDLLNTRYIVAPGTLEGTRVVYRDEQMGLLVLENPDALPRAFFVGRTEVVESVDSTWARLRSPTFNPHRTALLPAPIEGFETTPIDSSSTVSAELVSYSPREIVWQVETDAPRLFVASEVYYPAGWNAYLDDEEVPIYRVDYLLRGVPVSAGEHRLVMRFEPARHFASLWISGVATALVYGGVLVLLGLAFVRRRRRSDD